MRWESYGEGQWRGHQEGTSSSIVRIFRRSHGVYDMQLAVRPGVYGSAPVSNPSIRLDSVRTLAEAQEVAAAIAMMQRSE